MCFMALTHAAASPRLCGQDRQRPDDGPPITWDTLGQRIDDAVAAGFAGTILEAYGMANRELSVANTPDTIYGIGSTPIDFTRAGILLLAQEDALTLHDPITKYFEDVPDDKKAITIDHLMSGRSGLRDFHDLPTDRDPDHSWIDRDEAVHRIMAQDLLFAPGEGEEHSHSAWGLLAAIIEIASGQSYPTFLKERFFTPLGMTATGFFGEAFPDARVAIGYGQRRDGAINTPSHWGPTSWLVMGSGGMVSNPGDLYRWNQAMRGGEVLKPRWRGRYFAPPGAFFNGGDMYGFETYYTEGPGSLMILCSNAGENMGVIRRLARGLYGLVSAELRPKFSLGISMRVDDGTIVVDQVAPGSAAERDGLQSGDRLISAGGTPLGDRPMVVLDPLLRSGDAIRFEIERNGERRTVVVTPDPRS
jgi:CubicO group peptidase (beta-lactamase class C family)